MISHLATTLMIAAALALTATPAHAQQPQLPPGHPPPQQPQQPQLPPGHPPPQQPQQPQLPPGHPPPQQQQQPQLPPGHPPPSATIPPDPHPEHHEEQPPDAPPQPAAETSGAALPQQPGTLPSGHPAVPPGALGMPGGAAPAPAGAMPGGAPHGAGGAMPGGGMPAMDRAAIARAMRPPASATAEPSADVPVGTIRVTVVSPEGEPVADAAVDVGSLAQGDRQRWNSRTNDEGVAVFRDMPTGTQQAYRVNVPHEGATYSTTPFQLPTDQGYEVRVTRLPVTHSAQFVFFHTFRVIVEQRGERMHVIHQTELTNAGSETYVFPSEGKRVELPEDATAFQFQRVMTDQRVEEIEAEGESAILMRGSLPPGTVRIAYAYDIPIGDEDMEIPVEIPFPVFGLQILGEAIPGLTVDVAGMSGEARLDQHGQPCESSQLDPTCAWVLTRRRSPDQPPIDEITIRVMGIPGPSPVRWIAVLLALMFVGGGAFLAFRRRDPEIAVAQARAKRRQDLLDEARALEEDLDAGEVGPEYHAKRKAAIVRELAVLLAAESGDASRA